MQLKHSTSNHHTTLSILFSFSLFSLLYPFSNYAYHLCYFRFIRPEDIPVQYGGLSRPTDSQNGPPKPASEFSIKGGEKVNIQIEGIEVNMSTSILQINDLMNYEILFTWIMIFYRVEQL